MIPACLGAVSGLTQYVRRDREKVNPSFCAGLIDTHLLPEAHLSRERRRGEFEVPPPQGQHTADRHAGRLGSLVSPGHTEWPSWHIHILKKELERGLDVKHHVEKKEAQQPSFTPEKYNVGDFDRAVPAVPLPEAQSSGGT